MNSSLSSLYDQRSNNVAKSRLGLSLSKQPQARRFSPNATYFHYLCPDPGERSFGQLPSVLDYFLVTNTGAYILEGRLRYWKRIEGKGSWLLSAPVRLPVIVSNIPPPSVKKSSDSKLGP